MKIFNGNSGMNLGQINYKHLATEGEEDSGRLNKTLLGEDLGGLKSALHVRGGGWRAEGDAFGGGIWRTEVRPTCAERWLAG